MRVLVRAVLFSFLIHSAFSTEDLEMSPSKKVWIEFWQLLTNQELPRTKLEDDQEVEKNASFFACLLLRPHIISTEDFNLTTIHQQPFTKLMHPCWIQTQSAVSIQQNNTEHHLSDYFKKLYLGDIGTHLFILPTVILEKPPVALLLPWLNKAQGILTLDHIRRLHHQLKTIWELNPSNGRIKYNDIVQVLYPLEHEYIHDRRALNKSLEQWIDENSLYATELPATKEFIFKALRRVIQPDDISFTTLNNVEGENILDSWLCDLDISRKTDPVKIELVKGVARCVVGWNQTSIQNVLQKWKNWDSTSNSNIIVRLASTADWDLTNLLVVWQQFFPGHEDINLTEFSSPPSFWDLLDVYRTYLIPTNPRSNLVLKGIFDHFDILSIEEQQLRLEALRYQIDVFLIKDPLLLQGYLKGESRLIDILIDRLNTPSQEIKKLLLMNIHKMLVHDDVLDIGRHITPKRLLILYKSLDFVNTPNESNHLQAILIHLTKDHPAWDLAYRLYDIFGNVQGIGNHSGIASENCLRLPGGGYFVLTTDHFNQLWDTHTGDFKAINRNHLKQGAGKREVGALKGSHTPDLELCIKRFPEFPALEVSVTSFMNQLMGRGGIPSILVHCSNEEPWLLTPRIQLLERYNSRTQFPLDESIVLAMLTNPEDGNMHNYGVVEACDGAPYIVSIDNDHGFIPTIGAEIIDGGKKYTLQVKSLLFCMDEMSTLEVSHEIIQKLKGINAENFLKQWLNRLKPIEHAYLSLFPNQGISLIKNKVEINSNGKQTITLADDSVFMGMMFQESMIDCLFGKFQQLHKVLKHIITPMTYMELLAQLDPPIWKIYYEKEKVLQKATSSNHSVFKAHERFKVLHGAHYKKQGEKIISCTTMCGLAAALCGEKETRPDALRDALQQGKWGTQDGLAYFEPTEEIVDGNEEITRFKKLRTNAAKVSRLKELTHARYWQTLTPDQQDAWINFIRQDLIMPPSWKWLYVPALSHLTLSEFAAWRMIGIQELTLDGCLQSAPESLEIIANNSEALQRLSLRNLDWKGLEIPQSLWGISLPSGQQRFEWLSTLEIENCAHLKRIKLITPNLKRIKIHNAPQLTYEGLVSLTRTAPFLVIHRGNPSDLHNTGLNNDDVTLLTYDPHFPWEELKNNRNRALNEAAQFPENYDLSIHSYSPLTHRILKDFTNEEGDYNSSYSSPQHSSAVASLGSYAVSHSHSESDNPNSPYPSYRKVRDPDTYHGFYSRYIATCPHIAYHLEKLNLSNRHPFFGYFLIENARNMKKLKTFTLGHLDTTSILFNYPNKKTIFSVLPYLTNLVELEISIKKWHFKELFFKNITKMNKLRTLTIKINETLFEYSDSDISSFNLKPLPNLHILSLKGDRVGWSVPSTLFAAFSYLTNLHTLTLDHLFYNSIKDLTPSIFTSLKNLHTLIFINNPLHFENGVFALANALLALPQLAHLDLSNSDIGRTHNSWSGSKHSCERISFLIPALATLTNLVYLNLANNDLQNDGLEILVPQILASLNKLQILNLDNNGLNEEESRIIAQEFINHVGIENIDFFTGYEKDKSRAALDILKPIFERNRAVRIARDEADLPHIEPQDESYSLDAPKRLTYPRTNPNDFRLIPSIHIFLDHLQCIPTLLNLIQHNRENFPQNTTLYATGTMGLWLAGAYLRDPYTKEFMLNTTNWDCDIQNWYNGNSIKESQLKTYFDNYRLSDLYHQNTPNLVFSLKEKRRSTNPTNRFWSIDDAIRHNDETHDPFLKDLIMYLLTNNPVTPTDLGNEQLIIPPFDIT